MADKKEAPKQDMVVDVGFVIIVSIFIVLLWTTILNYILLSRFGSYANIWQLIVAWFFKYLWPIILVLSAIISILAVCGIIYNYKKLLKINLEEQKIYNPKIVGVSAEEPVILTNPKWERVQKHLESDNSSEWRLAIIEADVMLDELLRTQGYQGDSIGEMLKGVERSDMTTLDAAWEAHKVRNEVVHSGAEYLLNDREAKRVIALYESVFREFKII